MGIYTSAVQKLYVAYFNRPGDKLGVAFWEGQLAANGGNVAAISSAFSGSTEYATLYAGQTTAQLVNNLYINLFGRPAEADGLVFWSLRIANGQDSIASIALQLANNAQGTDAAAVAAKITAATSFTNALDTTNEIVGYSGYAANDVARTWLATVTNAATLVTATASVDATIVATVDAHDASTGLPFALTTGVDTFVGTAGADIISATDLTVTGLDTINGGGGTDTLNVSDTAGGIALNTLAVSNVEVLTVNSVGAVATADVSAWGLTKATIAAKGNISSLTFGDTVAVTASTTGNNDVTLHGGKTVSVTAVTGQVNVTGVAGLTSVSVKGGQTIHIGDNGKSTLTTVSLDGNTSTATLTGDAITTVSLANIDNTYTHIVNTTAAHTLNVTVNNLTNNATIADAAAGTVNIMTTGKASDISATFTAATALNVSGDVALTISSFSTAALATIKVSGAGGLTANVAGLGTLTSVDASASTGANTVVIDSTAATYTGGSGVDSVTVAVTATKAITGGAGTADVLTLNGAFGVAQVGTKATGFEVLGLGAAATGSYVGTGFSAFTEGAVFGNVTLTGAGANSALTVTAAVGHTTTVSYANDLGTSDVFNLKITNAAGINANTVTVANVETVNINSDDSAATPTGIQHTLTLAATSATSLVISGDAGLALTDTGTALTSVDASGITKGAFSFTTANLAAAATITGGAGDNTIDASAAATASVTLTGHGGTDILTGGAFADVIVGGDGVNTLIGNAGDDVITGGAGVDTITGGAGGDTIVTGAGADVIVYTAVTDSQGVTVDTIADFTHLTDVINLNAVTGGTGAYLGGANGYGAVLTSLTHTAGDTVFDTSTHTLYIDVDGSGTLDNADMAIILTGVTTLTSADFVF